MSSILSCSTKYNSEYAFKPNICKTLNSIFIDLIVFDFFKQMILV